MDKQTGGGETKTNHHKKKKEEAAAACKDCLEATCKGGDQCSSWCAHCKRPSLDKFEQNQLRSRKSPPKHLKACELCKDCQYPDCGSGGLVGGPGCSAWCATCKRPTLTRWGGLHSQCDEDPIPLPPHIKACDLSCKQKTPVLERLQTNVRRNAICCFCDKDFTLEDQREDNDVPFKTHLMRRCEGKEWLELRAKFYPECFCNECHVYSSSIWAKKEERKRKKEFEAKNKGQKYDKYSEENRKFEMGLIFRRPEGELEEFFFERCDEEANHAPKPCKKCKRKVMEDDGVFVDAEVEGVDFYCEGCWDEFEASKAAAEAAASKS